MPGFMRFCGRCKAIGADQRNAHPTIYKGAYYLSPGDAERRV